LFLKDENQAVETSSKAEKEFGLAVCFTLWLGKSDEPDFCLNGEYHSSLRINAAADKKILPSAPLFQQF